MSIIVAKVYGITTPDISCFIFSKFAVGFRFIAIQKSQTKVAASSQEGKTTA